MQTIFFFYGLAFLVMGLVIFTMPKKKDLLGLSGDLWLIGLFGILHGANEWVDMFILRGSPFNVEILTVLGALLLPLSFVPLLQFGARILFRGTRSFSSLKHLWGIALMGWAGACFLSPGLLIPGILARYFIGFPGAILAAMGLLQVLSKSDREKLPLAVYAGALGAGLFFILYGVLSGLVVPKADFLLASFINYPNFLKITGVPVQFFRMICAVFLTASFFGLAGIYAFDPGDNKILRRGGIQRKITLVMAGFSCVTALLLVGLVFAWGYQLMLVNIKQEQLRTARMLSQSVSEMIDQEVEELQGHLSSNVWKQTVEGANLHYGTLSPEAILNEMQEMDKKWVPAKEDSAFIKSYLERPLSRRLKNLTAVDENFAEIFLTDRYGGVVAASAKTSDFYQADESWWQKAYDGGKGAVFLGDIAMDESSGVLSFLLAIPIRNESGEVIGICKESINAVTLFSSVLSYKSGKTGHSILIDDKGHVLYHKGIKPLSVLLFNKEEMRSILQNNTEMVGKEEGVHGNAAIVLSVEKLNNTLLLKNGISWYVCVSQREGEIFQPLKQLVLQAVLLLGALWVIAIIFGIIVGDRLSKPVRELQKAAEKILAGDMDYRIKLSTRDEIEAFAESFNNLIGKLHENQDKLASSKREVEALLHGMEDTVRERTKDLSESQRATVNILEDLTETNEELKARAQELVESRRALEAKALELQRSEEFLKSTGQMAKVGGWELVLATQSVSWTDETYRIHEIEVGDSQGLEKAIDHYAPECQMIIRAAIEKTAKTGESFDLELQLIPVKTQKPIWVRVFGKAAYEDGKIVKLEGTFQDIDVRKRTEIAIKQQAEELELQSWGFQKANDGIKALYQEMEKKNVELAKLDQLKNDFVSIVAHELRNPLMVIREAALLILDGLAGPVEKEQKGYLTMVHKTSDQLIHITNDLLDLAKIESGKIVMNFEKVDLLALAKQSCASISVRAQKKAIVVSVDCPSRTVEIEADFEKLAQVMINLLSNALKFTEKGSITVEIKDLGEEVRCAVKDTGAGISEGNLLKLFNKFMQFTKKDALEEKGTGLGLVICKSIIKAHGGRMEVESELGKGSTFSFFLPKQQKNKEF